MTLIAWTQGTHVLEWTQTEIDGCAAPPLQALRPGAVWRWFGCAQRMDGPGQVLELALPRVAPGCLRPRAPRKLAPRLSGRESAHLRARPPDQVPEPPRDGFLLTDGRRRYEARLIRARSGAPWLVALSPALPLSGVALRVVARALAATGAGGAGPRGCAALGAEALVDTPDGPRPADALRPGDMVLTRDAGAQPLRWTGRLRLPGSTRADAGAGAIHAVRIAADALGYGCPREPLRLAPDHRLLLGGARAQALFGATEVLVRAADLVNDRSIRRDDAPAGLGFVQLLLDCHHVLRANGVPVESHHPQHSAPAPGTRPPPDPQLAALLSGDPGSYGPQARRCLSAGEAALLAA